MNWLPKHAVTLYLTHDEHKSYYEPIAEFIANRELADDFATPEAMQKAIDEDSLWVLHWYPNTPVSFHRIVASSLDEIQQRLKENNNDY